MVCKNSIDVTSSNIPINMPVDDNANLKAIVGEKSTQIIADRYYVRSRQSTISVNEQSSQSLILDDAHNKKTLICSTNMSQGIARTPNQSILNEIETPTSSIISSSSILIKTPKSAFVPVIPSTTVPLAYQQINDIRECSSFTRKSSKEIINTSVTVLSSEINETKIQEEKHEEIYANISPEKPIFNQEAIIISDNEKVSSGEMRYENSIKNTENEVLQNSFSSIDFSEEMNNFELTPRRVTRERKIKSFCVSSSEDDEFVRIRESKKKDQHKSTFHVYIDLPLKPSVAIVEYPSILNNITDERIVETGYPCDRTEGILRLEHSTLNTSSKREDNIVTDDNSDNIEISDDTMEVISSYHSSPTFDNNDDSCNAIDEEENSNVIDNQHNSISIDTSQSVSSISNTEDNNVSSIENLENNTVIVLDKEVNQEEAPIQEDIAREGNLESSKSDANPNMSSNSYNQVIQTTTDELFTFKNHLINQNSYNAQSDNKNSITPSPVITTLLKLSNKNPLPSISDDVRIINESLKKSDKVEDSVHYKNCNKEENNSIEQANVNNTNYEVVNMLIEEDDDVSRISNVNITIAESIQSQADTLDKSSDISIKKQPKKRIRSFDDLMQENCIATPSKRVRKPNKKYEDEVYAAPMKIEAPKRRKSRLKSSIENADIKKDNMIIKEDEMKYTDKTMINTRLETMTLPSSENISISYNVSNPSRLRNRRKSSVRSVGSHFDDTSTNSIDLELKESEKSLNESTLDQPKRRSRRKSQLKVESDFQNDITESLTTDTFVKEIGRNRRKSQTISKAEVDKSSSTEQLIMQNDENKIQSDEIIHIPLIDEPLKCKHNRKVHWTAESESHETVHITSDPDDVYEIPLNESVTSGSSTMKEKSTRKSKKKLVPKLILSKNKIVSSDVILSTENGPFSESAEDMNPNHTYRVVCKPENEILNDTQPLTNIMKHRPQKNRRKSIFISDVPTCEDTTDTPSEKTNSISIDDDVPLSKLIPEEVRKSSITLDKSPADKSITCGKCKKLLPNQRLWAKHNQKHNYLGWIDGIEEPIDTNDQKFLFKHLTHCKVDYKVDFFICEVCDVKRKSAQGIIDHWQICGKSKEEALVACEYCGSKQLPQSLKSHYRITCEELKRQYIDERVQRMRDLPVDPGSVSEEETNLSGRTKRQSVKR